MTVKRYNITWTDKITVTNTITQTITADDSDIAELAKRGRFRYTVI